jgi:hypothetical protein
MLEWTSGAGQVANGSVYLAVGFSNFGLSVREVTGRSLTLIVGFGTDV